MLMLNFPNNDNVMKLNLRAISHTNASVFLKKRTLHEARTPSASTSCKLLTETITHLPLLEPFLCKTTSKSTKGLRSSYSKRYSITFFSVSQHTKAKIKRINVETDDKTNKLYKKVDAMNEVMDNLRSKLAEKLVKERSSNNPVKVTRKSIRNECVRRLIYKRIGVGQMENIEEVFNKVKARMKIGTKLCQIMDTPNKNIHVQGFNSNGNGKNLILFRRTSATTRNSYKQI